MITVGLPASPADIDASWLNGFLGERHPGVEVLDVELLGTTEMTNTHCRLEVTYADAAGAPKRLFGKLPPLNPDRRQSVAQSHIGRREAFFYSKLAPTIGMRVPVLHGVGYDRSDESFVLLIEDLEDSGCRVSDGTWGIAPDSAAAALEDLAALHLRFEDPARRAAVADWVPVQAKGSNYGQKLLRYGLDHHRDRLSNDFASIAELYIDHSDVLYDLWHSGPPTVIHGDPHIGNLFDDAGRTGFLDWGLINLGSPLRDVSYFITMALDIEDRRQHERDLLRHYLEVKAAAGRTDITFDQAWLAHRIQTAYTVPASCQVVTFPADATPRRQVFAAAFLARAEAGLADLESRAAIRQVADL